MATKLQCKKIAVAFKVQGFLWSFAANGGAIGNYKTGIVIPAGCTFYWATAVIVEDFTSAGACNANAGYVGFLTQIATIAIGVAGTFSLNQTTTVSPGGEVVFSIDTNPATAGAVKFEIGYMESNSR